MNLAEKFSKESEDLQSKAAEITNEIVSYFKNMFEKGTFAKSLEANLTKENKIKRHKDIFVEYWRYSSGCSDTYFSIGSCVWKNPEGSCYYSNYYKGIDLWDIQKDVGKRLLNLAEYHLKDMGFKVFIEDAETALHNYKKKITISW